MPGYQEVLGDGTHSPNEGRVLWNAQHEEAFERLDDLEVPTIQALSANGNISVDSDLILCNTASGPFTATLHTAVGYGGTIHTVKKFSDDSNVLTLDAAGSETIDGLSSLDTAVHRDSVTIQSDDENWIIISPPTVYPA
jgi:hypothetical protein